MKKQEILTILGDFMSWMPPKDLEMLVDLCDFQKYKNKDIILESGDKKKKVFLVLRGVVRGYVVDQTGEEKTILLRSQGIFVGDADGLFADIPQKLTIESVGSAAVLMFSFEEFESLALKHESILKLYLNSLKEAILRLTYRVQSMVVLSNEERYLDLLEKNPAFLKDTYDKYVANFLGITPVSLSRIKKRLKLDSVNIS